MLHSAAHLLQLKFPCKVLIHLLCCVLTLSLTHRFAQPRTTRTGYSRSFCCPACSACGLSIASSHARPPSSSSSSSGKTARCHCTAAGGGLPRPMPPHRPQLCRRGQQGSADTSIHRHATQVRRSLPAERGSSKISLPPGWTGFCPSCRFPSHPNLHTHHHQYSKTCIGSAACTGRDYLQCHCVSDRTKAQQG